MLHEKEDWTEESMIRLPGLVRKQTKQELGGSLTKFISLSCMNKELENEEKKTQKSLLLRT